MQLNFFSDRRPLIFSLEPQYAELILSGEKKIEFRKVYPDIPTRAFIYVKKKREVLFAIDLKAPTTDKEVVRKIGGSGSKYFIEGKKEASKAMVIEKIWKLNNPMSLEELRNFGLTAPQGYIYLEKHPRLLSRLSEGME